MMHLESDNKRIKKYSLIFFEQLHQAQSTVFPSCLCLMRVKCINQAHQPARSSPTRASPSSIIYSCPKTARTAASTIECQSRSESVSFSAFRFRTQMFLAGRENPVSPTGTRGTGASHREAHTLVDSFIISFLLS